jgi:hypothetical protein
VKGFLFIASLFFLLFGRQNHTFASTHCNRICYVSVKNNPQKLQQKIPLNDNSIVIIEETDVEEETTGCDEFKNGNQNKHSSQNNFYFNKGFLKKHQSCVLNYYYNNLPSLPTFCANSTSIYIIISVFRI